MMMSRFKRNNLMCKKTKSTTMKKISISCSKTRRKKLNKISRNRPLKMRKSTKSSFKRQRPMMKSRLMTTKKRSTRKGQKSCWSRMITLKKIMDQKEAICNKTVMKR